MHYFPTSIFQNCSFPWIYISPHFYPPSALTISGMSREGSVTGKFSMFFGSSLVRLQLWGRAKLKKERENPLGKKPKKPPKRRQALGKIFFRPFTLIVGRRTTRENNNYKTTTTSTFSFPKTSEIHTLTETCTQQTVVFCASRRNILARSTLDSHPRMARVAREAPSRVNPYSRDSWPFAGAFLT